MSGYREIENRMEPDPIPLLGGLAMSRARPVVITLSCYRTCAFDDEDATGSSRGFHADYCLSSNQHEPSTGQARSLFKSKPTAMGLAGSMILHRASGWYLSVLNRVATARRASSTASKPERCQIRRPKTKYRVAESRRPQNRSPKDSHPDHANPAIFLRKTRPASSPELNRPANKSLVS